MLGATFFPDSPSFLITQYELNYNFNKRKQYSKVLTKAGGKEDETYPFFVLPNSLLGEHLFYFAHNGYISKGTSKTETITSHLLWSYKQKAGDSVWAGAVAEVDCGSR